MLLHYPWITPWNVYDIEFDLLRVLVEQVTQAE